ncbi:MAG TPA: MdtA/MuxA family multidrug efflux RND transporter periplasmic adaptor subunit [Rhizomicrobium sp.]|jgi:multidrug efflux system membrane fusion protein
MSNQDINRTGWAGRDPNSGAVQSGRFPWRRIVVIGLGFVAVVLLVRYLAASDKAVPQGGRFNQSGAMPVAVAKAQDGSMPVTLNALGTVTPLATVTVRPQVSGSIVKFDFTEGQMVKAGDVIAEIDPRPFQAAFEQAQGLVNRDKAALQNAQIDLQRYQTLASQNAISNQTLATQQALVRQDAATVKSDQGAADSAALNVTYAKVTSPVAGRAGIRQVDIGNLVQAGQTNGIVVVTEINPISVLFSLPEDNIDAIMAQVNAGATLTVQAFDRTGATKLADGKLSAVDSAIDTTTGTVKMRALFDNTDNALFPNQFVNIHLLVNTLQNQTLVPVAAIQRGAQGAFVWVVNPPAPGSTDKTVSMRTVTMGQASATTVVITAGLKPGDTVVVDGADRLKDDGKVSIPNNNSSISAPSTAPAGSQNAAGGDDRAARFKRFLSHLPPDQRAALEKMTPEERHAWMQAHRGQFHHGGGGGGGGGP